MMVFVEVLFWSLWWSIPDIWLYINTFTSSLGCQGLCVCVCVWFSSPQAVFQLLWSCRCDVICSRTPSGSARLSDTDTDDYQCVKTPAAPVWGVKGLRRHELHMQVLLLVADTHTHSKTSLYALLLKLHMQSSLTSAGTHTHTKRERDWERWKTSYYMQLSFRQYKCSHILLNWNKMNESLRETECVCVCVWKREIS